MKFRKSYSAILIVILAFSCIRLGNPVPEEKTKSVLEQVIERGVLRVVTDFSSTSYFIYRGQPMGYQYEMLQELANYLGVDLMFV